MSDSDAKEQSDAPQQEEEIGRLSDAELLQSFEGAAIHANRMHLTHSLAGIRLAFLEQHGATVPSTFRTAVLLSYPDALALRDLLSRQLKGVEEAMAQAESRVGEDDQHQG